MGAFLPLLSSAWAKVALVLGVVLAVLAALAKLLALQKAADRASGMADQLKNVRTRDEVDNRIAAADPAERQRLREKWTRH